MPSPRFPRRAVGGVLLFFALLLNTVPVAVAQTASSDTDSVSQAQDVAQDAFRVESLSDDALRDSLLAAWQRDDDPRTVRFANALLKRTSDVPMIHAMKAGALIRKDPEAALDAVSKAIDLDPDFRYAYMVRSNTYLLNGDSTEALQSLLPYLNRHPSDIVMRGQYAEVLMSVDRYEDAVEEYQTILGKDPTQAIARCNLAESLYRLGDVDAALTVIREALRYDPDGYNETRTYFNILVREGRYADALNAVHREVRIAKSGGGRPTDIAYVNRAFLRAHFDSLDAAQRDVERAFAMQAEDEGWTPNAYAYRSRAVVRIKTGNVDGGCADLQRAMDLNYKVQWGRWSRYGPDPSALYDRHCSSEASPSGNGE